VAPAREHLDPRRRELTPDPVELARLGSRVVGPVQDEHRDAGNVVLFKMKNDPRITTIGKFIRRFSIDELPQLFNVLKGDMSLIGPRPERPHFVDRFSSEVPRYQERHRAGVGLTGWAQVHGLRGDTSIPDRVRLDNYYIDHWSLWLDVVILFRTALEVIKDAAGR